MNIDSYSAKFFGETKSTIPGSTVSLDQRVGLKNLGKKNPVPSDELVEFCKGVMDLGIGDRRSVLVYLKEYTKEGKQLYNTTKSQIEALAQVIVFMNESPDFEGKQYRYDEIKAALVSVYSANMFVQEFMQDVFKLSDEDDDRESGSW